MGTPPYTVTILNSVSEYFIFVSSAVICNASSLVGARMIAWTFPVPIILFFLKYSIIGIPKANVFPEPVRSLAIRSSLLKTGLKQCCWIGKRKLNPLLFNWRTDFESISGNLEKSPSTAALPPVPETSAIFIWSWVFPSIRLLWPFSFTSRFLKTVDWEIGG